MDKKKFFNLLGVIIGVVTIILGIVFISTPADTYRTSIPDEASFGADFYTYEYEATRIVAVNAAVTANNIRELSYKLALYSGSLFIVAGLLILIYYLEKLFCKKTPIRYKNRCVTSPIQEPSDSLLNESNTSNDLLEITSEQ